MLKNSAVISFLILISAIYLLTALIPSLDPFHTGEYFVVAVNIEHGLNSFTIHGMVNYLPALISKYFFTQDYVVPTTFIIRFLALLASSILTLICYDLLRGYQGKAFILVIIFTISLAVINHNDLFLILSIYLYIKVIYTNSNGRGNNHLHQLGFGIVMALTLFWTFDRGIAAIVSIGSAYLFYVFISNRYDLFRSIYAFVFFILLLNFTFEVTSIEHYVSNVLSLVKSSNQWQYGNHLEPILFTIFATFLLFLMIINIVKSFISSNDDKDRAFLVLLFIVSLFYFKSSINRADINHIVMNLIPLLLLISFRLGRGEKITLIPLLSNENNFKLIMSFCLALFLLGVALKSVGVVSLAFLFVFVISENRKSLLKKLAVFFIVFLSLYNLRVGIKHISKYPTESLASEGNYWASEVLLKNNTECIFDLTNNGIINALSNLPTCTIYSYPIYTPYEHEHLLLEQLIENKPNTIIYSSTFWSYQVDGITMSERYPDIEKYIKEHYEYFSCKYDYCMMSSLKFD